MVTENAVHLRIKFDDGLNKVFTCGGEHRRGKSRTDDVYSYRHATDLGWRFTTIRRNPRAVCPDCADLLH
jgi:hypothetical protein